MRRSSRPVALLAGIVLGAGCAAGLPVVEDPAPGALTGAAAAAPVHFDVTSYPGVSDEGPAVHRAFELLPRARVAIHAQHDRHSGPGPVTLRLHRVLPNGTWRHLRTVDGTDGLAATSLRSVHGGTYVLEVTGEPRPATLALDVACLTERCSPHAQPGQSCGGPASLACAAGLVCHYPERACGAADAAGTCEVPPPACIPNHSPVCACDGTTYLNSCEALSAGAAIDHAGACASDGCRPICGAVGTQAEGWYDGCSGSLLRLETCAGCDARCELTRSPGEGWYSTCDGLIAWGRCGAPARAAR